MDKIMLLQTQQGKANILASSITGFITGNKRGTGYVLINGVGTSITDCFDEAEREWKEWFDSNRLIVEKGERPFEFKGQDDNMVTVRLSDVRSVRRNGHFSAVYLADNVIIHSQEDYYDLRNRFTDAMK